jgi:hypothetical protein
MRIWKWPSLYKKGHKILFSGSAPLAPCIKDHQQAFKTFLLQHPEEQWCFGDLDFTDDGITVAHTVVNQNAMAVSDGLYKKGWGTAAWILVGDMTDQSIQGAVFVSGDTEEQDSYRSEVTGLFCILVAVT